MFFSMYASDPAQIDLVALEKYAKAMFAGGCFWCIEPAFKQLPGVIASVSGYSGGTTENPTSEQVYAGNTGHYEVVQVYFNPDKISYPELVETFWRQIDPTDQGGQFYDRGQLYKTAIFYRDPEQKKIAERSKEVLEAEHRFPRPIVTEILPAKTFYPAEEHHQNYAQKEFMHYKEYREASGRERFIKQTWNDKK